MAAALGAAFRIQSSGLDFANLAVQRNGSALSHAETGGLHPRIDPSLWHESTSLRELRAEMGRRARQIANEKIWGRLPNPACSSSSTSNSSQTNSPQQDPSWQERSSAVVTRAVTLDSPFSTMGRPFLTPTVTRHSQAHFPDVTQPQQGHSVSKTLQPPSREEQWVMLEAEDLTSETFAPFGDVIDPVEEDVQHGPQDATVDLTKGTPRLYVMRLRNRRLQFDRLTHHASVTQTLGALGSQGAPWYLAVARCSIAEEADHSGGPREPNLINAKAGHTYAPPRLEDVRVFRIEGSQMVNLRVGTWHQGPFFRPTAMDFYNLELSNTGEVDHTCHDFGGIKVEIVDPKHP